MTRRKLTEDEAALWRKVTESAERLQFERRRTAPHFAESRSKPDPAPRTPLQTFEIGTKSLSGAFGHDLLPGISERLEKSPVQMDRKAFGKLKRGRLVPEGRIDLHGMTLEQAQPALTGFILRAQAAGKRLVLVITGKGRTPREDGPIPMRRGAIKHQVPQWLSMPPVAGVVLQIVEAHQKHGGSGAYYVYLRKR
ncbi:DNA-nicking endonuclease, Smr domain [Salinihabitans flavidus]|uniref:DNA-nicking endonuclease, Smr domain n=1 Tax=Salinihabitans flavidus TaxID=569882 RepID=A0A1H8LZQ9_9RHOB|nr:Smr/MutS family protein [Salinihabitans flavidus]SEO10561.1 DNA-nicking endonuclease, Smr domain [Salinihabitans flavidus]